MGDWPEGRVPCAENPERWELLTQLHTDADIAAACLMAGQAIHICRRGPGARREARAAAADPPVRHVQAGVIYDRAGAPLHLFQWRDLLQKRLQVARRKEAPV